MIHKKEREFKGEVVKKRRKGDIFTVLGKKYHFEKGGGGQKYHISGKYTPLSRNQTKSKEHYHITVLLMN